MLKILPNHTASCGWSCAYTYIVIFLLRFELMDRFWAKRPAQHTAFAAHRQSSCLRLQPAGPMNKPPFLLLKLSVSGSISGRDFRASNSEHRKSTAGSSPRSAIACSWPQDLGCLGYVWSLVSPCCFASLVGCLGHPSLKGMADLAGLFGDTLSRLCNTAVFQEERLAVTEHSMFAPHTECLFEALPKLVGIFREPGWPLTTYLGVTQRSITRHMTARPPLPAPQASRQTHLVLVSTIYAHMFAAGAR